MSHYAVDIPNSQLIYVSEKAVSKVTNHFIKLHYWFLYEYNPKHNRHEFKIGAGVDLLTDVPSKLGKFITSAEGK